MTEILPRWTGKLASLSVSLLIYAIGALDVRAISLETDGYHVQPGEEIQAAIEGAATNPTNKHVWVHSGTYQPSTKRQALIWFNRKHSGVKVTALGEVNLDASNTNLVHPQDSGFPAAVNHVVYFGEGVAEDTVLSGFRITGANGFFTKRMLIIVLEDTTRSKISKMNIRAFA